MTMSLATRELHGSGVYGELAISNPLGICADLVGGEWRDKTVKLSPHTMPTVAVLLMTKYVTMWLCARAFAGGISSVW
jgi:hypothetical protein